MKTLSSVALSALLLAGFSGCGGSSTTTDTTISTAYYLDAAVEGVDYVTSGGMSGQTGADGAFKFIIGDTVSFTIGDLVLRNNGSFKHGEQFVETDDAVITFLQSLDSDGNATNGITLTTETKTLVTEWLNGATTVALDVNGSIVGMTALQTTLNNAGVASVPVTVTEARAHVETTLATVVPTTRNLGDQIVVGDSTYYVDYTNALREAPASAAAAEYHTGTGYGNTKFDSAENKCQNCHNELYDTWSDSMHGKSWSDNIFQSKFQDFLRTHINKIGEDKSAFVGVDGITGIEYTEAKILGVAQTCIKCHAPESYYAGDFKVTLDTVKANATTADLTASKSADQSNLASTTNTYDPTQAASVVAVSHTTGTMYKATYQIGHTANREGINCAFCHSIETPRLMGIGNDNDTYTLKDHIRVGPHGPAKAAAGSVLTYDVNASAPDMNKFFRLWGPEKYVDPANTPKNAVDFDVNKSKDGRYTMHSVNLNGTNGKTHFTGGPYYGPYGVTGKTNENDTDDTNRTALINRHFDKDLNNPFEADGKGLCLTCHQRSAGAAVPAGEEGAGQFMELCSTQIAVSNGIDAATATLNNGYSSTATSPKCQKCHMARIDGTVLHKWGKPNERFTTADVADLVGRLAPDVNTTVISAGNAPVRDGWYNSHAFLGASKTGHKTSAAAKIKSGFDANVTTVNNGTTLTVTTTFMNKTAHMFPGAHPMRRVLSRLSVTDGGGAELNVTSSTGSSAFANFTHTVIAMDGRTMSATRTTSVTVDDSGNANLSFPGKVTDMNGSAVSSQKFDGTVVRISGTDNTLTNQEINGTLTTGTVANAAIVNSSDKSNFTRVYGHETGTKYDLTTGAKLTTGTFVVRPGFDSNMIASDNRLSPNETETYTTTYDITGRSGVSTTYKIYYMQKGANGKFISGADGWLDQAASDAKKLLVTEVFTKTVVE